MAITKELRKPMLIIDQKVQSILDGKETNDDLKYLIYSSHDDAISNTLLFLNPVDHFIVDIPYASSIFFELHYDDKCLAEKKDRSCFKVFAFHNNTPIKFDTCLTANANRGS